MSPRRDQKGHRKATRGRTVQYFAWLLRSLGQGHIRTPMGIGQLTPDDREERLVDHYSFYAAFETPEEHRLVTGNKTLQRMLVSNLLSPRSFHVFAGRRRKVRGVDEEARAIELTP